jgi:hypothetical protein
MSSPGLLHSGDFTYYRWTDPETKLEENLFGDYSATFFDPKNPGTVWTFQTYATSGGGNSSTNHIWGTWLNALSP